MQRKTQIHALYFVAAVLAVIWLRDLWVASQRVEQISYSAFEQALEDNRIESVEVDGTLLRGKYRSSTREGAEQFVTPRVDIELARDLAAHNVEFRGVASSGLLREVLSWVLPALMFFALWMFVFRRVGDRDRRSLDRRDPEPPGGHHAGEHADDAAERDRDGGERVAGHDARDGVGDPGDEVLVPDPYYATYEGLVAASGATFVPVPTTPEDRFHVTAESIERRITPNSPPSGERPMSYTGTTPGCSTRASARASRRKRARASSSASARGRTFSATCFCRRSSTASSTCPMPPRAMRCHSSYASPRLRPECSTPTRPGNRSANRRTVCGVSAIASVRALVRTGRAMRSAACR